MILFLAVLSGLAGLAGLTWAFIQPTDFPGWLRYYTQVVIAMAGVTLVALGIVLTIGVLVGVAR